MLMASEHLIAPGFQGPCALSDPKALAQGKQAHPPMAAGRWRCSGGGGGWGQGNRCEAKSGGKL